MSLGRRALIFSLAVVAFVSATFIFGKPAAFAALAYMKGWTERMAPFALADDVFYVGSQDLTAYLITTSEGFILLDGGVPENAGPELDNIKALGFDPRQVRVLLNSHAHFDHAGVLAQLKAETGAKLYASERDAPMLEGGGKGDFLLGDSATFPPVKVDRLLKDGDTVGLGATTLAAHVTAGHTKGCTSWSWTAHVAGKPVQALSICSLTVLPQAHLTGARASYPGIADDFRRSLATLKALPCELFLSSHGGFFDLQAKRAAMKAGGPDPFVDPAGCRAYIARSEAAFETRLAAER